MMESTHFLVIAITPPDVTISKMSAYFPLLESKAIDYLHLRKPEAPESEMRKLVEFIPNELRSRIKLHSCYDLALEYGLGGIHLNKRSPSFYSDRQIKISKSCHAAEEISDSDCYEYVTLSPIFDSISKTGYSSDTSPEYWSDRVQGHRVVALGGVTPEKFTRLKKAGFSGAAMLGAVIEGIERLGIDKFKQQLLERRKSNI